MNANLMPEDARHWPRSRELGQRAEQAVADYYAGQGFEIVARNYLVPRMGELDLVLRKQDRLSFVEVKARHNAEAFGGLPATITAAKLRRLRKAAGCFLKNRQYMNMDTEFLAALVEIDVKGQVLTLRTEPIEWL